jgi:hypothetical protein
MRCDKVSTELVKRARGALAGLGLLVSALGLGAPTSAAAQAVIIELSTAAPPVTHRARPGPLIEVVSLESHRLPPAPVETADTGSVSPVAFTPALEVTSEPAAELDAPLATGRDPTLLEARFVAASERGLAQLRAMEPSKLEAALRKLQRKGEVQVLAQPRLSDENQSAAVSVERPADAQEALQRRPFQAYGAELKLRRNLGDGLLRVDLKTEVDGDARGLESSALRQGQTLVMTGAEAPRLEQPRASLLSPTVLRRPEPRTRLAVIVTARAADVAEPPTPLQLNHSPRGPPGRSRLAILAGHIRRLLEKPYGGAKAVLSAIGLA